MAVRAHHVGVSFLIAAIVLGSLAFLTVDPRVAQAACATGSSVVITSPSDTTTTPLAGIISLRAQSTPTTASGLSFMLLPSSTSLGEATLNGTEWSLSWDTRNQPNGTFQLMAIAHFGTATSLDCASAVRPAYINNVATQSPSLTIAISPSSAQLPVGESASFGVDTLYVDQYGRSSHVSPATVNWHSPLGSAAPNGGASTVFTAGTTLTTGPLIADVTFSGLSAQAFAQIKVVARIVTNSTTQPTPAPTQTPALTTSSSAGTSSPTPTPAPVSAADVTRLAAMPTVFRPTTPTNSNPVVNIPTLSCMEKALGSLRFNEISSGTSQPTAKERKLTSSCFSGAEPVPAILAPIAPAQLTELQTTTDIVTVASIKNQTVTSQDGKKVAGLLLSGKGAPNSSIFIYVFSDPLVLRAETDSKGAWNYVLETPLKAGHHEVYAVAEKDSSSFVRTSVVPISIAAASSNQDGNLIVDRTYSSAQLGFAAAAAVMVLAAIGVFFTLLRRRRHLATPALGFTPAITPPPVFIMPAEPSAIVPTDPPNHDTQA